RIFTGALLGAALLSPLSAATGETLQIGIGTSDVQSLDVYRATGFDSMLLSHALNGLVRFPPGSADLSRLEPDLAERWEESPDHLTWTFHLRKGVQFQGGNGELRADDVVYSYTRAMDAQQSSY